MQQNLSVFFLYVCVCVCTVCVWSHRVKVRFIYIPKYRHKFILRLTYSWIYKWISSARKSKHSKCCTRSSEEQGSIALMTVFNTRDDSARWRENDIPSNFKHTVVSSFFWMHQHLYSICPYACAYSPLAHPNVKIVLI